MLRATPRRRFLDQLGKNITAAVTSAKDTANTAIKQHSQQQQQPQQQSQQQPREGSPWPAGGGGFTSWSSTSVAGPGGAWNSTTTSSGPLANIWSVMQQQQQQQQGTQDGSHGGGGGNGGGGGGGGGSGGGGGGGGGGGPFGGGFGGGMFDKMLEWCSKAHARDIARRQGIDLRDVHFTFGGAGGDCTVTVDAPGATPAQIAALGTAVQEECPVARFRKTKMAGGEGKRMDWIPLPPPGGGGSGGRQ